MIQSTFTWRINKKFHLWLEKRHKCLFDRQT